MKLRELAATRLTPCRAMALHWAVGCAVVLLTACATHTEPLIHRVPVEVTREAPVDSARAVATGAETPGQAPVEVVREVPVEVTRIVPREVEENRVAPKEVIREVPVEVTRIVPREVEVTRIAPKEVVREVIREVLVTPTPRPRQRPATATPRPMPTPTTASMQAGPTASLVIALPRMGFIDPVPWRSGALGTGSLRFIYDPLLGTDSQGRISNSGLAESWELSEDGTEWAFHLRQGIPFHHGEGLVVEDMIFSMQKWLEESSLRRISDSLKSIEPIDDYTLRLRTNSIARWLPWDLTDTQLGLTFAIPGRYYEEVGPEGFARDPIGTGPYRHIEHLSGERLVLEAVQRHWREGVPTKHLVRFLVVQNEYSKIAALKTGQVDIISLGYDNYDVGDSGFQVFWREGWTSVGVRIHQQWDDVPIADIRVRQALNYAIDRVHLADALFGGWARPAAVPIRMPDRDPYWDLEPYPYDPEKTRQLLTEAGYPDGFEMTIHAYDRTNAPYWVDLAEFLAESFAEIGVHAVISATSYPEFRPKMLNQTIPGDVSYWTFPNRRTPGLVRGLEFLFRSSSRFTTTKDPELDWLIEQSINEPDPFKQEELVNELLWRTHENANYLPLLHVDIPYAASDKVPADWDLGRRPWDPDYLDVIRRR